ncbi:MAG: hypothetical protein KZQ84_19780 [Candidatus Thiodiazotropha sp. (ex Lucinoma borealis)]|nr:hypothetical protein [Candidatus Thiodiazotropha sp. (ex Lucinoma borealis)]
MVNRKTMFKDFQNSLDKNSRCSAGFSKRLNTLIDTHLPEIKPMNKGRVKAIAEITHCTLASASRWLSKDEIPRLKILRPLISLFCLSNKHAPSILEVWLIYGDTFFNIDVPLPSYTPLNNASKSPAGISILIFNYITEHNLDYTNYDITQIIDFTSKLFNLFNADIDKDFQAFSDTLLHPLLLMSKIR